LARKMYKLAVLYDTVQFICKIYIIYC